MSRKPFNSSLGDFVHAVSLFMRRLRVEGNSHDFSWTESAVIGRLATGGSATTAELARAEGMKPQSMRTTLTSLEESGAIARKPHPTDGRQVNIELTARGRAVRKSVKDAKHTWLAQAIARLDAHERETLFAATEIIKQLAEEES